VAGGLHLYIMKIAVCIKQVPARDWQPRVDAAGTGVREADIAYELNEPDAYALEAGLRLKEQHGGEVVVCSAGPARVTQVLREALARGADRGLHVESEALAQADAVVVGGALAAALRAEGVDLVLTGLQSDDQGFAQTGVVVAERLGLAHATIIMDVQATPGPGGPGGGGGTLRVKRELEGGWFQHVTLPLPAVLTIQSGINPLRYATLKGIMAAKKKPIQTVAAPAGLEARQTVVRLAVPEKTKQTTRLTGTPAEAARALVQRLRDDARVLG